jgi:hypothetical protein
MFACRNVYVSLFACSDLSVVLADPHAMYMILVTVIRELHHCINSDTLPRENANLQLLFRLLSLGVVAWEMNHSSNFKEPKMVRPYSDDKSLKVPCLALRTPAQSLSIHT